MLSIKKVSTITVVLIAPIIVLAATLLQTDTGYIYPADMKHADSNFYGFDDKNPNFGNRCHLANDYNLAQGSPIYAMDKGVVQSANANIPGYNSAAGDAGAIVIKHQTSGGVDFYAVYGHIKNLTVAANDTVTAGQKIAEVGPYSFGEHLHFGINTVGANLQGYTETTACTDNLGFVDPEVFMAANHTVEASCKAVDDTVTTTKNTIITSISVLSNDTDADGDTLTISAADANSSNGVAITNNSDGMFTYTPAIDFVGADTFSYTISDGKGCSSQGTVSITVTDPDGSGDGSGNGDDDSSSGSGSLSLFGIISLFFFQLFRRRR